MNARCDECRFWDDDRGRNAVLTKGEGLCKRHAPTPETYWAATEADDWCGEFEPIEDEEATPDETLDPPELPDAL